MVSHQTTTFKSVALSAYGVSEKGQRWANDHTRRHTENNQFSGYASSYHYLVLGWM
jgi:hypothetical protein